MRIFLKKILLNSFTEVNNEELIIENAYEGKVTSLNEENPLENEVSSTEKHNGTELDQSTILQLFSPSSFPSSSTSLDPSSSASQTPLVLTSPSIILPSNNQSSHVSHSSFYQLLSPSFDFNNIIKFKKPETSIQISKKQQEQQEQHLLAPISDFHHRPPPLFMPSSTSSATFYKITNNNNLQNNDNNEYETFNSKQQRPLQQLILNLGSSTQPIFFESDTAEEHNYCEVIGNESN